MQFMIIYNTTYQVDINDARNFVIWINESYIPAVIEDGRLKNPRLCQVLSHKEEESECFTLQWEVENSAELHKWHTTIGMKLNEDMMKVFKNKVVGFPTLMEVIR